MTRKREEVEKKKGDRNHFSTAAAAASTVKVGRQSSRVPALSLPLSVCPLLQSTRPTRACLSACHQGQTKAFHQEKIEENLGFSFLDGFFLSFDLFNLDNDVDDKKRKKTN